MADILEMVKGKVVYAEDVLELFYVASAGQDKAFVEIVEDVIQDTPTADVVEVKHGEWIDKGWEGDFTWRMGYRGGHCWQLNECSVCRYRRRSVRDERETNFCPNCGAKMDGRRDT